MSYPRNSFVKPPRVPDTMVGTIDRATGKPRVLHPWGPDGYEAFMSNGISSTLSDTRDLRDPDYTKPGNLDMELFVERSLVDARLAIETRPLYPHPIRHDNASERARKRMFAEIARVIEIEAKARNASFEWET